jgi:hypothetical protein
MTKLRDILNGFVTAYVGLMPYSLIVTLFLVGALFFVWLFWQSDSKNEIKADEARSNVEVQSINTAVSNAQVERVESQVERAEKDAQRSVNRAKKARETNISNVNIQDSIRKCEEAYGKGECS